jgi:KDO2-lipid IV(A) lauroyltransferase
MKTVSMKLPADATEPAPAQPAGAQAVARRHPGRGEAVLLRLLWGAARLLPVEVASMLGGGLMGRLGPRTRRHEKVRRNLEIAFPERDPAAREALARGMWAGFGRALAEYPHLPAICRPGPDARMELRVDPLTQALIDQGRPLVFVAAHLANWNIPGAIGPHLGIPLSVVYRRRHHPSLEAAIAGWRDTMEAGFIDVSGRAPREMFQALSAGRSVGLFIDRRVKGATMLPFFGTEVPTTTVPARLAIKAGSPIVPCRTERLPGVRFRVTLEPPIHPDPAIDDPHEAAAAMTAAANRVLEGWIRARPEEWLCTSSRWPRRRAA